jgi:nucleoside-diphosphate-sugar epimerase
MNIFLTGGTGFIGGHVAAKLRERGDNVRALVRSPEKAKELEAIGCEIVAGTLADDAAVASCMEGCDAVIHGAAIYEVGIPASRHEEMRQANVAGTERVLRAALDAGIPKVVYISTVAVFGDTDGEVVDESYKHPAESFTSFYEQTKYEAHQVALGLIEEGLPCVIVQPGGVYGPGDHSELANLTKQTLAGKLPLIPFPEFGVTIVHVDDVAAGVLLALDAGRVGEAYVLGGDTTTNRELITTIAELGGRKPPTRALPSGIVKAIAPFGRVAGPLMGFPPNMRELITSTDGVTFWASSDKAKSQLGYAPRDLQTTIADTLRETGKLKAAAQ